MSISSDFLFIDTKSWVNFLQWYYGDLVNCVFCCWYCQVMSNRTLLSRYLFVYSFLRIDCMLNSVCCLVSGLVQHLQLLMHAFTALKLVQCASIMKDVCHVKSITLTKRDRLGKWSLKWSRFEPILTYGTLQMLTTYLLTCQFQILICYLCHHFVIQNYFVIQYY